MLRHDSADISLRHPEKQSATSGGTRSIHQFAQGGHAIWQRGAAEIPAANPLGQKRDVRRGVEEIQHPGRLIPEYWISNTEEIELLAPEKMAALGYKESQLDQTGRSRAGAVGVMQLTAATGKAMDVGDINQLDPNIHAGVKYIRFMVDTYYQDPQISALNKVLFAFAAYNAGPNRIRSLRKEAAQRHLDANVWFDNVERVVSEHIGRETVQYVSNIYKYYIAYSLVQDDVARNLQQAEHATH